MIPVPEPVSVNRLVSSSKLEEPGAPGLPMSKPMKSSGFNPVAGTIPASGVTVASLESGPSPCSLEAVTIK
ncbi:hypothetical protein D3C75_1053770 [compost metagenome]